MKRVLIASTLVGLVACSGNDQQAQDPVNQDGTLMEAGSAGTPGMGGTPQAISQSGPMGDGGPMGMMAREAGHAHNAMEPGWYVTSGALNVRSGPSMESRVTRVISRGTRVMDHGRTGVWVKVAENEYVSSRFLADQNQFALQYGHPHHSASNGSREGMTAGTYKVNIHSLYVRGGPGTSFAERGVVFRGQELRATGRSGNWIQIGEGQFVSARYLTQMGE